MSTCRVCEDATLLKLVESDMRQGLGISIIATRHRVRKSQIAHHVEHIGLEDTTIEHVRVSGSHVNMRITGREALATDGTRLLAHDDDVWSRSPFLNDGVTENPERQFQQAWALAKDDQRMRARMVQWLNEQIQADDMGLP